MTSPGKKKVNAESVNHAQMVSKAMDMVKQGGYTWDQIAEETGYASRGSAHRAVKNELAKLTTGSAEELVQIELARLDALQNALWDRAMKGAAKTQVAAVRQILGVMLRRSKLLGLDDFERRTIELAERKHALNNMQSQLVYEFMNRVMNAVNLSPEQRAQLPDVIPGELARITEAIESGKTDDDDA